MKYTRREFLLGATAAVTLPFIAKSAEAAFPGAAWATRTPAQVGLDAAKLLAFRNATGNQRGIVIRDGFLVYQWGDNAKFDWASAAKPVHSTILFFAIKELRTSGVNARIFQYGWPLRPADQSITWHHLANQTSGYALPENPGARWGYNDYAIKLYHRTLYERVYKQSADAVARTQTRLGRLQFQDGSIFSSRGGFGLFTSPRDFARIGWFWLNRGNWNGTQLLPRSYFDNFMKNQVSATLPRTAGGPVDDYLGVGSTGGGTNQNFLGQGRYGYNWWFNRPKVSWPDGPADVIQALGHGNAEAMFIVPSLRMVVAWKGRNSADAAVLSDGNRYLKLLKEAAT